LFGAGLVSEMTYLALSKKPGPEAQTGDGGIAVFDSAGGSDGCGDGGGGGCGGGD